MKLSDFDYELPPQLIAQHPADERSASRLLHLDGASGELVDRMFGDLPQLVGPGDVLVLNDTRVIKARLTGRNPIASGLEIVALVAFAAAGGFVVGTVLPRALGFAATP